MKKRPNKSSFSHLSNEELKAAFQDDWSMLEISAWQIEVQTREHPSGASTNGTLSLTSHLADF